MATMAISAEMVKQLRDKTGAGMMECKAALTEANGNMEEATTLLRKRGLAQAAKRTGRTTAQGAIGAAGGVVESPDQSVELVVPAAALSQTTSIAVTKNNAAVVPQFADVAAASFVATPHDQVFAAPATLTLRWKDRDPAWLAHYRELLDIRKREITPLELGPGRYRMLGERAFEVTWDGLKLIANCGDEAVAIEDAPAKAPLWSNGAPGNPWTVNWWK